MIVLGSTVSDKITGFGGVVIGHVQYLTGCNQALVLPKCKPDGAYPDPTWIDEQRLVVDDAVPVVALDNGPSPGFDKAPPKR